MVQSNKAASQKGVSLIEALIAIALLSGISLTFGTIIVNLYKHMARTENKTTYRQLEEDLKYLSSLTANCGIDNLAGGGEISVTDSTWMPTTHYTVSKLVGIGQTYAKDTHYDRLTVEKIELAGNYDVVDRVEAYLPLDGTSLSTATHIAASIRIDVQSLDGVSNAFRPLYVPIELVLSTDRASIVGCQNRGSVPVLSQMCAAMGGSWSGMNSKCQLPCPPGSTISDDESKCIFDDLTNGGDKYTRCSVTKLCDVNSRFLGASYE